ncbi:STAS/SEC14 domain-containing protein [Ramlibacter tataouinensis]|uniref:STAS/SEC14 domain-containing protein n=1 Tax=Ramlibacter tataouinensis (strain ATCC BAA-407 / DSM 14655 / LMG 21543 / TTB310) TaxID=365046 RepID=F5XYL0_RAMTT|nr:STAS/SEC14 domain-containing protein [Ramlibacter tataouinensis]AEG93186.1 hypothetical protein Rta_20920 [Ramlibacter tataouinensis TTB310]
MAGTFKLYRCPEFAVIELAGPATAEDFAQAIATVAAFTRHGGDRRALANLLAVEGQLAFTQHFQMGHQVARQLGHLERMASVVPEDKITRTSEKVAQSLGMTLRVFTRLDQAQAWLRG